MHPPATVIVIFRGVLMKFKDALKSPKKWTKPSQVGEQMQ